MNNTKGKILITGNAGMIGSVLTNFFIDLGYDVVGVDNLSRVLRHIIPPQVNFYKADITDQKKIDHVFTAEKPDYVVHCAAFAAEVLSPWVRNLNYSVNVVGSANIINACINHNIRKLINFSSIATYGEIPIPFKECDERRPKDCYGIAKLAVELDLREAYEHFGLRYSTVLPHNVISKYQNYYDPYRNVIAIWIRQCLQNENVTIYGDGLQQRAFSDCKYLCQPILRLLNEFDNESFNIGSDEETRVLDAANIVLNFAREKFNSQSKIIHLEPRREVKLAIADHTKAKEKLLFYDKTNLQETIEEMFYYAAKLPVQKLSYIDYEINKEMHSFWRK